MPQVDDRTVNVAVSGGADVAAHGARASSSGAGVRILDVGLRRPTLDDVFLTLTGRAAEEANDPSTTTEEVSS